MSPSIFWTGKPEDAETQTLKNSPRTIKDERRPMLLTIPLTSLDEKRSVAISAPTARPVMNPYLPS